MKKTKSLQKMSPGGVTPANPKKPFGQRVKEYFSKEAREGRREERQERRADKFNFRMEKKAAKQANRAARRADQAYQEGYGSVAAKQQERANQISQIRAAKQVTPKRVTNVTITDSGNKSTNLSSESGSNSRAGSMSRSGSGSNAEIETGVKRKGGATKAKKFAALAPPYNKATAADRIAGAKKSKSSKKK